ncbi:hypothetical protein FPQ18DRAFT_387642 [Pyronema domesticum]|uniref:Uncharacterized protein n=1 Tax=Pyronema omphalodes (strain CBS 100304) TaxID=1076935 RepID=U4LET9_PYROM|nr:hypothetical protein FPQ18DRAFT_387642 [Pyronema domesticum]CCX13255.1 Protein of unknown function [Pyronema omphalodes CBS 100304]
MPPLPASSVFPPLIPDGYTLFFYIIGGLIVLNVAVTAIHFFTNAPLFIKYMFYTTRFIVTAPYRAWKYICRVAEKEQEDAMAHQSQGDELAQSAAAETWPNYN